MPFVGGDDGATYREQAGHIRWAEVFPRSSCSILNIQACNEACRFTASPDQYGALICRPPKWQIAGHRPTYRFWLAPIQHNYGKPFTARSGNPFPVRRE